MYLHKHASANNISLNPFPFQWELSMEAYIIENPSVLSLESVGLEDAKILLSEAVLLNGRKDNNTNGRIDILAGYGGEYLAIVELKMGRLEFSHLEQLQSYLKEKQQILDKYPEIWDKNIFTAPKWIGILVGTSIDPELMLEITKKKPEKNQIPIAALTINRYQGKDGSVYVITDTYFVEKLSNKDLTKYEFNGQIYGKGRLVLAVIKDYIQQHPETTYSELENVFPHKIQGTQMFTTQKDALKNGGKNYFIKPEELIKLKDDVIAVSCQWGNNFDKFQSKCKDLKIEFKETSNLKGK